MRVIFVGGGTSGHVNPAINIISYIKKNDPKTQILYVGTKNSIEEKLVKNEGIKFETITISGFSRSFSLKGIYKNFKTILKLFISDIESKNIINDFKPSICLGTGGYVCGPFLNRANKMKIPFLLHEQNSVPGLTTRILSKKAAKILLVMSDAKKYFCDYEIVGNPIKNQIILNKEDATNKINKKYKKKLDKNKKTILSFGGSLGSDIINDVMFKFIFNSDYNHIHAYGKNGKNLYYKIIKENYITNNKNIIIEEYIDDMYTCMMCADLVICRSGSMTISELIFLGKPSILIPSPNVTGNHQYFNALSLANSDSALMIEEKNLIFNDLKIKIENILNNEKIFKKYSKNIKKMLIEDSNEKIYNLLKKYSIK